MTKSLIAALVALGFVGAVTSPVFAHRSQPQPTVEKPFPKDFWDQMKKNGA